MDYCELLISMHKGTEVRKVFDRALQALPITQHKELWKLFIDWATGFGVEETSIVVYRRYLMYEPSEREKFVEFLESIGQYEEAARQLSICLNDEHYVSPSGQSSHQLWMRLCDICSLHPQAVADKLPVEQIIRSGIARFSDEVGRLWSRLADFYIRLGQFERARDVYEEAINSVSTVRDFTIIFDAYVKVEETVLTTKIRFLEEGGDVDEDVDLRLSFIEHLMDNRPILLNSVMLRQNPNNVYEWHKRIKLIKEMSKSDEKDQRSVITTYVEALRTIDPSVCIGKISSLWLSLARLYEKQKDLPNARITFQKATEVKYKSVDELANVWCAWGEMEMRYNHFQEALSVMRQSVVEPLLTNARRKERAALQGKGDEYKATESNIDGGDVKDKLHRNVKVWSLLLDLEESLGSSASIRSAYDKVMELKAATVQMCLNYSCYLEEHDYFEDSFQVLERSLSLFVYPQLKAVWLVYLDKFEHRYGRHRVDRLRDLYESAVANVPPELAAEFFIKYGKMEEKFGLARHALSVYDRATLLVPSHQRLDMYRLYLKKVGTSLGATRTRPVYERAMKELDDGDAKLLCMEFADMERKLGEIDRSRAIWRYGAQFADPRRDLLFWQRWRQFEEAHGNEDTFRDMLRVQRAVETSYSQVNYLASEMSAGSQQQSMMDTFHRGGGVDAMEREAEKEAVHKLLMQEQQEQQEEGGDGRKRKFGEEEKETENEEVFSQQQQRKIAKVDEAEIDI